jgi:hypothetical protein
MGKGTVVRLDIHKQDMSDDHSMEKYFSQLRAKMGLA